MTSLKNDCPSPAGEPVFDHAPIESCPILLEARITLSKARDLHKALRHLSRSTSRCLTCPHNQSCPSINYFKHAIDLAIEQLTRQWNLDQY